MLKMTNSAVLVLLSICCAAGTCTSMNYLLNRLNGNSRDMAIKINAAFTTDIVEIYPGITLERTGKSLAQPLQLDSSGNNTNSKAKALRGLHLLYMSVNNFLAGRVLKIRIPDNKSVARALSEGKEMMNNMLRPFRRVKNTEMMLNSILGFLVAKAIVVAKFALAVALVNLVLSIFSGGFPWSSRPTSFYGPPSSSYGAPSYSYGPPAQSYGAPPAQPL